MPTTTPRALIESKLAEDVLTKQYEAVNCKTAIDKLTAVNVTGANVTMLVYLVPPSGVAGVGNQLPLATIAPGKSWSFPDGVGHILESGGAIWTDPSAASAVAIRASGREFT
jgi:enterochelin esterase-like enzyme